MVLSRAIYLKVTARVVLMMATALVIHCNGGGKWGAGGITIARMSKIRARANNNVK